LGPRFAQARDRPTQICAMTGLLEPVSRLVESAREGNRPLAVSVMRTGESLVRGRRGRRGTGPARCAGTACCPADELHHRGRTAASRAAGHVCAGAARAVRRLRGVRDCRPRSRLRADCLAGAVGRPADDTESCPPARVTRVTERQEHHATEGEK
jgi:hypothetical protein